MDKQKQIEEMVGTMANWAYRNGMLWHEGHAKLLAEVLLEDYQPKIPENAVIVSKQIWEEHIENWDKTTKVVEERVRKETAEKFAERLKSRFDKSREYYTIDTGTAWGEGQIGGLINDKIDKICKEFTEGKS